MLSDHPPAVDRSARTAPVVQAGFLVLATAQLFGPAARGYFR